MHYDELFNFLALFARLVFTLLDLCRYKYWLDQQTGLFAFVFASVLAEDAWPPVAISLRSEVDETPSSHLFQIKYGFRFLFGDAEEKKEVMCHVLNSY